MLRAWPPRNAVPVHLNALPLLLLLLWPLPACLPPLPAAVGTSASQLNRVATADKRTYSKREIINACGWGNRTIPSDANMLAGKRRGQRGATAGREDGLV